MHHEREKALHKATRREGIFLKLPKEIGATTGPTQMPFNERAPQLTEVVTGTFHLHFKCNDRQNNSNRQTREDRFVMRLAEDVTVANAEADDGSFSRAADERQDEEDFPLTHKTRDQVQN